MSSPESPTVARAETHRDSVSSPSGYPQSDGAGSPPEPGAPNRWGVLRHKHYRNVLAAQTFSNVGTWVEMFAIQMFIAQITGRLDDQGYLGVVLQLPVCLLGLLGGLAADRLNRRTLLVVTQIAAGVVAAGSAWIVGHKFADQHTAVNWLFVCGALNGAVMAFNFPAWQVLTPRLVPKQDLGPAITLTGIQFNFARILGPAIAGVLFAWLGPAPLLWFNAATFVVMSGVIMTTPDAPAPPKSTESIGKQFWEAWSFLMHNRGPRAVFWAQFTLCLLAAPLTRMLCNYVIDVYGVKAVVDGLSEEAAKAAQHAADDKAAHIASWLLSVQGIGAVTAGLCLKFVPKWYPKHHFIPLSVAALGISITVFALTRSLWSGYAAMAVCGWFWMWAFNQSWAQIQVLTPDNLRGRAMSVTNVAVFGAMALGSLVSGLCGEQLKVRGILDAAWATQTSILMLSVPLVCAGIWMMLYRVPEVDGMPRMTGDRRARSLLYAITAGEHRPRPGETNGAPRVAAIQEQEPM